MSPRWLLSQAGIPALQGREEVKLYEWKGTKTHCVGLYRTVSGGATDALGMICMDTADGDTCFWDNKDASDNKVAIPATYTVADGRGGDLLAENCTLCHRGSNPWIQTEVAPLTGLPQPPGDKWRPVGGRAGWNGWDPATSKRGTSCSSVCHQGGNDPELTPEYCGIALELAKKKLMDPADPSSDNWMAFDAACKKSPPGP